MKDDFVVKGGRENMVGESKRPHNRQETNMPCRQALSEEFIEKRVKGRK